MTSCSLKMMQLQISNLYIFAISDMKHSYMQCLQLLLLKLARGGSRVWQGDTQDSTGGLSYASGLKLLM